MYTGMGIGLFPNKSSAAVPNGAIMSLTIVDATPIDPVSSVGASGSGWVAIVKLKGLTSLVGTAVPTALTISVSDPGYDTSGNVTTVNRTITGVSHLRRQYPNGNSKMISTDGTDLTLYITLDDWVYSGTTIVSASIGGTFYPSCTASSAPTKINLSTESYKKALTAWINPPSECSSSTYNVELLAFHRHARNGQQVACVKFAVSDGGAYSTDQLVSSTSLSTRLSRGNIPEVWPCAVDFSGMTQAAACNVRAKVYPWIGDSSAVLDLSATGASFPSVQAQKTLRVICDRTGGYGGGYAYVNVGAGGGTVSATPATAKADPFPTIAAALSALKTWNNANKGHNDCGGGFIRLMDNSGANQTHNIAAGFSASTASAHCYIEKDPASAAVVTVTCTASLASFPTNIYWRNLTMLTNAGVGFNFSGTNTANDTVVIDNVVIDNTGNKQVFTWYDIVYPLNLTTASANNITLMGNSPTANLVPMYAGCVAGALDFSTVGAICYVGNYGANWPLSGDTSANRDGFIIHNNRNPSFVLTNASAFTYSLGVANVQNLFEQNGGRAGVCMNLFADSDLATITNYVEQHNTAIGARCSRMYNDVAGTRTVPNGVIKLGSSRYNIWNDYNNKGDTVTAGVGGTGNWAYGYSVGNDGNVSLFGDVQCTGGAPHNDNGTTPFLGMAWLPSSNPSLFGGLNDSQIMALFPNYTVAPQASPATGGNYKPVSGATQLKSRVPTGLSTLKYDIAGTLRRTDGTGAAGAYESS